MITMIERHVFIATKGRNLTILISKRYITLPIYNLVVQSYGTCINLIEMEQNLLPFFYHDAN